MNSNLGEIAERSSFPISYEFQDADGNPAVPTSGRYRVDDITTGRQVRGWSDIAGIAATGSLALTPEDTRIMDRANSLERRTVQIEGTFGVDDTSRIEVEFDVRRVSGME